PSVGKLYATMYFQGKMTLDEMRDELGMSKPSMSTSVRKLQKIGMVKKVFQRGSRKDTYTAEKDFFRSFTSFYCQMRSEEHTSELQSRFDLVCRLLLEEKKITDYYHRYIYIIH